MSKMKDLEADIIELFINQKLSISKVAEELGVKKNSLATFLHRNNIKRKAKPAVTIREKSVVTKKVKKTSKVSNTSKVGKVSSKKLKLDEKVYNKIDKTLTAAFQQMIASMPKRAKRDLIESIVKLSK